MKMNGLIYIAQIKLSRKNDSFNKKGSRIRLPFVSHIINFGYFSTIILQEWRYFPVSIRYT
jgi:hypothetical protein